MQEYVIRNTRRLPVLPGYRHAGEVLPYITADVDGEPFPVAFTAEESARLTTLGEPAPVPAGLRTTRPDA